MLRDAAIFSSTMREYSARVQVPSAIIRLRRAIVSQEAKASSAIIKGRGGGGRRERFFICNDVA
jgi:hypothetical protein